MPFLSNQSRAILVLAKASFKAILSSPVSVVFSLLFPVIFIVVFGSMIDTRMVHLKIALEPGCDTANVIYRALVDGDNVTIDHHLLPQDAVNALHKGRLTAIMNIEKDRSASSTPHYIVSLTSATSSRMQAGMLQLLLNNTMASANQHFFPSNPSLASLQTTELPGRVYRQIDFILPGQLGFFVAHGRCFCFGFYFV